jgi:hypothetical protein
MNVLLYIIEGILILLFLLAGVFKLIQPREKIISSGGSWAEDVSPTNIKIVGIMEVLLGSVLLVTLLTTIPSIIATITSVGMGMIMLAAAGLHIKRKEYPFVIFTLVLVLMAFFVAVRSY